MATTQWLRGFWEYYKGYTHTAVHTASAAALTGFGLLFFIDPLFVVLAIATYVCPPVILYSIGSEVGSPSESSTAPPVQADSGRHSNTYSNSDSDSDGGDSDADSDDGDSDADGYDGDSDADGYDGDSDADSDDGDRDADGYDKGAVGTDADG